MSSFFEDKIKDIDVDGIKQNAKEVLSFTGTKAKDAYGYACGRFNKLDLNEEERQKILYDNGAALLKRIGA